MSRAVFHIIWASDCVADLMLATFIACIIIPSRIDVFSLIWGKGKWLVVVVKLNIMLNRATLFIIGIYINVLQCRISIVATGIWRISMYGMACFWHQNAQCIVNFCNKSPVVPHKCHPPIKTSTQLLYEGTGPSNQDVSLLMARIMDDTSMMAYEGWNCRRRCKSV